jgi:hypothetical protein
MDILIIKRDALFLIFFLLVYFSCQKSPEGGFVFEEGKVSFLDSTLIDDSNFSLSVVYNPKIYNDTILGFGEGSFLGIHLFHAKSGLFLGSFESDSLDNFQIPQKNYANFSINGDTVFMLNNILKKVFAFGLDKTYYGSHILDFGSRNQKPEFQTLFERKDRLFLVSTVYDGPLSERFRHSKIVTVFDENGKLMSEFGNYPSAYTEGNLVLSQNEIKILKNGSVFILNVAGQPILKEYDLEGGLKDVLPLQSRFFDTEIGYYDLDPFAAPLTDQFCGMATDQNSDKKIFYMVYHDFQTRDRENGIETYRWMLSKVDFERNVIKEAPLAGVWHLNEVANLIPSTKGDTLLILMRNGNEELYLKRLLFD